MCNVWQTISLSLLFQRLSNMYFSDEWKKSDLNSVPSETIWGCNIISLTSYKGFLSVHATKKWRPRKPPRKIPAIWMKQVVTCALYSSHLFLIGTLEYLKSYLLSTQESTQSLCWQNHLFFHGKFPKKINMAHFSRFYSRVREIYGDRRRTVFPRDFAQWVDSPSFSFLRYREVVGAPFAFLASDPPDFIA